MLCVLWSLPNFEWGIDRKGPLSRNGPSSRERSSSRTELFTKKGRSRKNGP